MFVARNGTDRWQSLESSVSEKLRLPGGKPAEGAAIKRWRAGMEAVLATEGAKERLPLRGGFAAAAHAFGGRAAVEVSAVAGAYAVEDFFLASGRWRSSQPENTSVTAPGRRTSE